MDETPARSDSVWPFLYAGRASVLRSAERRLWFSWRGLAFWWAGALSVFLVFGFAAAVLGPIAPRAVAQRPRTRPLVHVAAELVAAVPIPVPVALPAPPPPLAPLLPPAGPAVIRGTGLLISPDPDPASDFVLADLPEPEAPAPAAPPLPPARPVPAHALPPRAAAEPPGAAPRVMRQYFRNGEWHERGEPAAAPRNAPAL